MKHKERTSRLSGGMMQNFGTVDNSKTLDLDVTLNDNVKDVKGRVQNNTCCCAVDMYVSFEGNVLEGSDEVKAFGMKVGSTLQMNQRVRGGGDLKNKKHNKQDKQTNKQQRKLE